MYAHLSLIHCLYLRKMLMQDHHPSSSKKKIYRFKSTPPFALPLTDRTARAHVHAPIRLRPRDGRPPHPAGQVEHTTPARGSKPAWSLLVDTTRCASASRLRLLLLRRWCCRLCERISQKEREKLLDEVAQAVWLRVQWGGGDMIPLA